MEEQKKALLKMLTIVNNGGQNEDFADFLTNLIIEETIYQLMQSLPARRRESVGKKWDANSNNPAALNSLLQHNFTKKQMSDMTEKVAQKAIEDYLRSVDDRLDETQREKLQKLSEEFTLPN